MSKQKLQEMLSAARDLSQCGQIHVVGVREGKTSGATLVMENGDIVSARCMGQSGRAALEALLSLEIGYVQFLSNAGSTASQGGSKSVVSEFLKRLSEQPRAPATLRQDAQSILQSLYGGNAAKKIAEIAKTHPPAEKPREFIDQCIALVAAMLGKSKAAELFGSLSDQVEK